MKKFLFTILVLGFGVTSYSQEIAKNALGLRLGDNDGFGTEISYQRALGGNNRAEFGLGWNDNNDVEAYKLTGLYQWVWNLEGGFNWYVGVGGGVGSINYNDGHRFYNDDYDNFFAFAAGDIGIEYNFDIPLLLSLDFRPELNFHDYRDDLGFDIALGVRYQF